MRRLARLAEQTTAFLGSPWFGSVLLAVLMIAMGAATVLEPSRGRDWSLGVLYGAAWFRALLALSALSLAAGVVEGLRRGGGRWGFLLTHGGIVLVLLGGWITHRAGVEGRLPLREGQGATAFWTADPVLRVAVDEATAGRVELPLRGTGVGGPLPREPEQEFPCRLGPLASLRIVRYLPDAELREEVVAAPTGPPAVEIAWRMGHEHAVWVLAGESRRVGPVRVRFEAFSSGAALTARLQAPPDQGARLRLRLGEATLTVSVPQAQEQPVALGRTGYRVKVLRYLPHAVVGAGGKVENLSAAPANPAVEVELTGPKGKERRLVFARFPDMDFHRGGVRTGVEVRLLARGGPPGILHLVRGPDGALYARTAPEKPFARIQVGGALAWRGHPGAFAVKKVLPRAQRRRQVIPVTEVREQKEPALLVQLRAEDGRTDTVWLARGEPATVHLGQTPFVLTYTRARVPLGFTFRLERFRIVPYPGGRRPRSFESSVRVEDRRHGTATRGIIRMNHPFRYGGYTFYQSAYRRTGDGWVSILQVSRDPGEIWAFAGYILTFLGMVFVLRNRIQAARRKPAAPPSTPARPPVAGAAVGAVLLLLLAPAAATQELPSPELDVSPLHGIVVEHDGRWMPLDTLARDLVWQVTGSVRWRGRDATAVLLAWTLNPAAWREAKLLRVKGPALREELGLARERQAFSYEELRTNRRLAELARRFDAEGANRKDPLVRTVQELETKLMLLRSVFRGEAIRPVPDPVDPLARWRSIAWLRQEPHAAAAAAKAWLGVEEGFRRGDPEELRRRAAALHQALAALPAAARPSQDRIAKELRLNRLRPFHWAWPALALGALLALGAAATHRRWLRYGAVLCVAAGMGFQVLGLSLRWSVAGRIPAANMFESLLFLAAGASAAGLLTLLWVRAAAVGATGAALGALALALPDLANMDRFIRPAPPVLLDTFWMSVHVPIMMTAYALLGLAMLAAHAELLGHALGRAGRGWVTAVAGGHRWLLHGGAILLFAGIATGSMWAASSWGRYWGWDPKEVWSLIAFLAYMIILHREHAVPARRGDLVAAGLVAAVFLACLVATVAPVTLTGVLGLVGGVLLAAFLLLGTGPVDMAAKSVLAFWCIVMTYVGVNYILGVGLHSYGFGTGAVAARVFALAAVDLLYVGLCWAAERRRRLRAAPAY